jgi:hypothetical protein
MAGLTSDDTNKFTYGQTPVGVGELKGKERTG